MCWSAMIGAAFKTARALRAETFFFRAEDGIRDRTVTGVQTCALPISYDTGGLGLRVYCFIGAESVDKMIEAGVRTGFGSEWVRVGGMKQVADGAVSGRTARLSQPYIGSKDDYGTFSASEEELYENGRKAYAAGWQLGTHANGDVAIERVLNVYERLNSEI